MRARRALCLALLLSAGSAARAQEAPPDPHGGGASAVEQGDPHGGDPHGADPHGGDPHGGAAQGPGGVQGVAGVPGLSAMEVPTSFATEDPRLPGNVVLVRVVDGAGQGIPDVTVRLGVMSEGQRGLAREGRTRFDGSAQFEGLATGGMTAYRASVESDGVRALAPPFQLDGRTGRAVQLVRFPVMTEPRSILVTDVRMEVTFADDRLVVRTSLRLANFTAMSMGGQPNPRTWAPQGGLRWRLPVGYSNFRTEEQSMGDQRLVEQGGEVVFQGSLPPTSPREQVDLAYTYRYVFSGTEVNLEAALPQLPVLAATVATQAPAGMRLTVEGFPDAQERRFNGQRILLTGRERRSRDEAAIGSLRVRLSGLPAVAGLERTLAVFFAAGVVLLGLWAAQGARRRSLEEGAEETRKARREQLEARRERLLAEARGLLAQHRAGEVGPESFSREKRLLVESLAAVLRELSLLSGQEPKKKKRKEAYR